MEQLESIAHKIVFYLTNIQLLNNIIFKNIERVTHILQGYYLDFFYSK